MKWWVALCCSLLFCTFFENSTAFIFSHCFICVLSSYPSKVPDDWFHCYHAPIVVWKISFIAGFYVLLHAGCLTAKYTISNHDCFDFLFQAGKADSQEPVCKFHSLLSVDYSEFLEDYLVIWIVHGYKSPNGGKASLFGFEFLLSETIV